MFLEKEKAAVLIESLPYIKEFYGKTIVIKYGGSAMIDEKLKDAVMLDLILMQYVGIKPVIVHGGGKHITEMMSKLGKAPQFFGGLRVTDEETMRVTEMVLSGQVNQDIVARINVLGGNAVGISGKDGHLIKAMRKTSAGDPNDVGLVGRIESINATIIGTLHSSNFIPVISPVGVSESGETLNINADTAAYAIAAELKAYKLIIMTDVKGVLKDIKDDNSLIPTIPTSIISDLKKTGVIDGGMIPKLDDAETALNKGVHKVHIIDGRIMHSILLELFTKEGVGTQIIKD